MFKATTTAILVLASSEVFCIAQTAPYISNASGVGITPTGMYDVSGIDTVNPVNGNVQLSFPLASLPANRSGSGLQVRLDYNSKIWEAFPVSGGQMILLQGSNEGAWRYTSQQYSIELDEVQWAPTQCTVPDAFVYQVRLVLPDGSKRVMRLAGQDDGNGTQGYYPIRIDGLNAWRSFCEVPGQPAYRYERRTLVYYSADGSYIRMEVLPDDQNEDGVPDAVQDGNPLNNRVIIYLASGTRVMSVVAPRSFQIMEDPRGVKTAIAYGETDVTEGGFVVSRPATWYVDEHQRVILAIYKYQEVVDLILTNGVNNTTYGWLVLWGLATGLPDYQHITNDVTSRAPPWQPSLRVLAVQLPSGLQYGFEYGARWGELSAINLPERRVAGTTVATGRVEYKYTLDDASSVLDACRVLSNAVASRKVIRSHYQDGVLPVPSVEEWRYTYGGSTTVTGPDGSKTSHLYYPPPVPCSATNDLLAGKVFQTRHPDGRVVDRIWRFNRPYDVVWDAQQVDGNPFVEWEVTTYTRGPGQEPHPDDPASAKRFVLDKNGNVLRTEEYEFGKFEDIRVGANPGVRRNSANSGLPATNFAGPPLLRQTERVFYPTVPQWSQWPSEFGQLYNSAFNGVSLSKDGVRRTTISSGTAVPVARTDFEVNDPLVGLVTTAREWDSTKGALSDPLTDSNSKVRRFTYDAGQNFLLTGATDGRGINTAYVYEQVCGGVILYPTVITVASGTPSQRSTRYSYDCNGGLPMSVTDLDNNVVTSYQRDVYGRATVVTEASNVPADQRSTRWTFDDAGARVIQRQDVAVFGDGASVSVTHTDAFGKLRLSRSFTSIPTPAQIDDELQGVKRQRRFGYGPRFGETGSAYFEMESNDFSAATSAGAEASEQQTMGWTRREYDGGRRIQQTVALGPNTGTNLGVTKAHYYRTFTTVVDPAGVVVSRQVDSVGRVGAVIEAPTGYNAQSSPTPVVSGNAIETRYQYDALDNLTRVDKSSPAELGKVETRLFFYSSLSRLMRADNPESGSTCYGEVVQGVCVPAYDAEGNLLRRTDARGVVTRYTYDELGRQKTVEYEGCNSNSMCPPLVTFTYDDPAIPFSRGRRTRVSSTASQYDYLTFDALGQIRSSRQTTDGRAYTFPNYSYTKKGDLLSLTYPSGRVVSNGVDAVGRVQTVGLPGSPAAYIAGVTYSPSGSPRTVTLGNGLSEEVSFNPRLQVTEIQVLNGAAQTSRWTFSYGLTPALNNGNVTGHTVQHPGMSQALTQSFTYDVFNRLATAKENNEATWFENYGYDQFGNRWTSNRSSATLEYAAVRPNGINWYRGPNGELIGNRLSQQTYDAAGNLRQMNPQTNGYLLTYDAEGRVASGTGMAALQNVYDGEGRRVKRTVGSEATVYVYDAFGSLAAEYRSVRPTQLLGRTFMHSDVLGSTRLITSGTSPGAALRCIDYAPYGERIPASTQGGRSAPCYVGPPPTTADPGVAQQFTGKERDAETGFDYSEFRYLSSAQGRFTSPDPEGFGSYIEDPQSWNRYVYARNNPLRFVDPLGLDYYEICGADGGDCGNYNQKLYDQLRKDNNYVVTGGRIYSRNKNGTQGEYLGTVARRGTGIDDRGDSVVSGMAARADASNQFIGVFAVGSVAFGATGGAAANLMGLTSGSGLTTIGSIEVSGVTAESSGAFTILNNQVPPKTIADLTRAAQKLYPNKANRVEAHHIFPKYMGGPANGSTVQLNGSYHQVITNAFRNAWGYGQGPPAPGVAQQIMQRVYALLPYK